MIPYYKETPTRQRAVLKSATAPRALVEPKSPNDSNGASESKPVVENLADLKHTTIHPPSAAKPLVEAIPPAATIPLVSAKPPVSVKPLAPEKPPAKVTHLINHALARHTSAVLLNKATTVHQFRQASNQLLGLLMFEGTRNLASRSFEFETAAGSHTGEALAKPVILLTLAKHGLGLAHNVVNTFPGVIVGSISMNQPTGSQALDPRLHIANAPALCDAAVVLFAPLVASGASAQAALSFLRRSGASNISLVSFFVSLPGVSRLHAAFPDLHVWTARIDSDGDSKNGLIPALGEFEKRLYL